MPELNDPMNKESLPAAQTVAIVDYGLGNLFSIKQACEHAGLRTLITSDIQQILSAGAVILPGVGAFGDAMDALNKADLAGPLRDAAASGKPLIGICLGLQLLMTESCEFGRHRGLGLIEGPVIRFDAPRDAGGPLKVPQVGWNRIHKPANGMTWANTLLDGIPNGDFMYFIHSFHAVPEDRGVVLSLSRYGDTEFCSSLRKNRIYAFQFHPERSGPSGLALYRNIATLLDNTTPGDAP